LPFVVLGAADVEGGLQATLLTGAPGFVRSPDATRLTIDALPAPGDPLAGALQSGDPVGLLGIELPTRRRNRANGRVMASREHGMTLQIAQSFGNCPKYIQRRELLPTMHTAVPGPAQHATVLDARAAALIGRADTFFIASRTPRDVTRGGYDVSHRGGRPGFVCVGDAGRSLSWPDYSGNALFNTLGNLMLEPEAALVFADFDGGDLLHVNGRATIIWEGAALAAVPGAERLLRLEVERVLLRPAAWPLRWRLLEMSPVLPAAAVCARS
jgi:predicted pyridoxine 5'-phosphate oxidase superfamily flavin-nucleotide-binding protein